MASATVKRTNSNSRQRSQSQTKRNRGGRNSGTLNRRNNNSNGSRRNSGARNSGGRAALAKAGRTNSSLAVNKSNQPILDFTGLMATIEVMNVDDAEYEDTCQIFLSSRYQNIGPFHRLHKESQLITKDQWVEYWSVTTEDRENQISRRVAAKMFDTCSFLAKGKSGVTPTALNNLQKSLPRTYRGVTSSGAGRQLAKFSWYRNGQEQRDISRPSQILSPQKYEELIARLRAETRSLREQNAQMERTHQRETAQFEEKLTKAKAVISRLKQEVADLKA